jgi:uncharacterized membrane protein
VSAWSEPRLHKALLVSLALNAFLIGALVVSLALWQRFERSPALSGAASRGLAQLTEDERKGFRQAMQEDRARLSPLFAEARDARQQVRSALSAESLDTAAAEAALARVRDAESRLKIEVDRTVLRFVATLPPARRLVVSDALRPGRKVFDGPGPAPAP